MMTYIAIAVTALLVVEIAAAIIIHKTIGWAEVRRRLQDDSPIF